MVGQFGGTICYNMTSDAESKAVTMFTCVSASALVLTNLSQLGAGAGDKPICQHDVF